MRVEEEGGNAEGKDGEPEVDEVRNPDGHGGIEEEEEVPHAHVDTGAGEPRVQNGKVDASCGKATACCNVASSTERHIAEYSLGVDLGGEDLEHRGHG